jgi:transposase-like protein
MNCPRCQAPMVDMGEVKCRTGDARRMVCPRCKVTCYEQGYRLRRDTPLDETLARLARVAMEGPGLVTHNPFRSPHP